MQRSIIKTTTTVKRGETTLVTTIIKTTVEPSAVAVHRKHLDDKRKEFVYYHVTYLRDTEFFRTSPVLEPFKHYLDTNHTLTSEQIEAAFTKLIPVTSYEDYEVFQNRILAKGPEAQTEDILFSGKAHYFLNSSATSGGKSKLFAICADHEVEKLAGTIQLLKYQCTLFEINSLAARYIESFPVCAAATIINRLARKANGLHTDADIALVYESGIPLAIKLIKHYPTLLVLHALFALVDSNLFKITTVYSSILLDWIKYIQNHKDELVDCIEFGVLPAGLIFDEELDEPIKQGWKADPHRAYELKLINFGEEGWIGKVWPSLKFVEACCAGQFAAFIPPIQRVIGVSCTLSYGVYAATEGFVIGISMQDTTDPNLFHLIPSGIFEFMEAKNHEAKIALVSASRLRQGVMYRIIISNKRLGIWRYDLGDILEFVTFHPRTGNPIMRYIGRESGIRLTPCLINESEILKAAQVVFDNLGNKLETEFVSFIDSLNGLETVAFCFEAKTGALSDLAYLEDNVTLALRKANSLFDRHYGRLGRCILRVLCPGAFTAYRAWRAESVGVGQVKVPIIVRNSEAKAWFLDHSL